MKSNLKMILFSLIAHCILCSSLSAQTQSQVSSTQTKKEGGIISAQSGRKVGYDEAAERREEFERAKQRKAAQEEQVAQTKMERKEVLYSGSLVAGIYAIPLIVVAIVLITSHFNEKRRKITC